MIFILFAALPTSGMSQPVTMELRATVDQVGNQIRQGSIYLGPAVTDSSIPFQIGDGIRFIFTYDPAAVAILGSEFSQCSWLFEDAIVPASLYSDRYSNLWSQAESTMGNCETDTSFRIDLSPTNANVNELIEDLPFYSANVTLYLNTSCFGTIFGPPVLPATGITPENNCLLRSTTISVPAEIILEWKQPTTVFQYYRGVRVYASQNISLEFPENAAPTPAETEVVLNPVVALPEGVFTTAQISFQSVETPGTTTVVASAEPTEGASAPLNFKLGDPPVYFDVATTAGYSGDVELCFYWQQGQFLDEATASLLHYEDGAWQDVTISRDVVANKVCGRVATLSPFAIVERSFAFDGFFPPVDNRPVLNIAKAGSSIPVNFDLNGDQGTAIFSSGYPASQSIACDTNTPSDVISETVTAGKSGLSYDAGSDLYTYVWKTDKTWAQACRRLLLKLRDGSIHTADFRFQK